MFLAVNKIEGEAMALAAENFRQLGMKKSPDQRGHGLGIGDLLDAISEAIPRHRSESDARRKSPRKLR